MPTHEGSYPPARYKAKPARSVTCSGWRPNMSVYLICLWIVAIYYHESYIFKSSMRSCAFETWVDPALPNEHTLAFIGDPQLVDENTYRRRGPALAATKFYTDLYMRRNYKMLHTYLQPELILFTGDLFDGGREWGNDVWEKEYERFKRVFAKPVTSKSNVIYSLPGNHDIGISDGIKYEVYQRFRAHFGETSKSIDIGAWEVILFDTVALSSPDHKISASAREFLSEYKNSVSEKPRMLLTHVPLYRDADAYCGPLRETNTSIKLQRGFQYQNVLDTATSQQIWSIIKPSVIFAGDDHDYCDYRHPNGIHVINVKSFSWAMGIRNPGFQLVSLSGSRYETKLCLLPNQLALFLRYGLLLFLSFIALMYSTATGAASSTFPGLPMTSKDDDGKRNSIARTKLQIWRITWQRLFSIAWPILLFYVYMIWW